MVLNQPKPHKMYNDEKCNKRLHLSLSLSLPVCRSLKYESTLALDHTCKAQMFLEMSNDCFLTGATQTEFIAAASSYLSVCGLRLPCRGEARDYLESGAVISSD